MLEKKEYKGVFYLPKNPDRQIAGVLYFYPNEAIRLELIGACLSGENDGHWCNGEQIEAIFGVVKTEDSISQVILWNCFSQRSKNQRYDGRQDCEICMATYTCSYLLQGKHLANKEDKVFKRIRVSFPRFNDWYSENGIQFDCEGCDTSIFKTTPEPKAKPQKFKLNDKQTLNLFGHSYSYSLTPHKRCLEEQSYVEFETVENSNFYDLLINVGWFRDLYSFAAMTEMPFSEIYLYEETGIDFRCVLFYAEQAKFIEPKDTFVPHHFLFDFSKTEDIFETIVQTWYDKKQNCEPILQHLISSVTYRRFIDSSDFLKVTQAIEGYYCRFIKDGKGFYCILNDLYEKYNDVDIIADNKPCIGQVVDSRNHYSHLLPDGKKENVQKDFELLDLTEKLKPLLVACILTLIGFENQKINELLNDWYQWYGSYSIKLRYL